MIFHSYASVPEGTLSLLKRSLQKIPHLEIKKHDDLQKMIMFHGYDKQRMAREKTVLISRSEIFLKYGSLKSGKTVYFFEKKGKGIHFTNCQRLVNVPCVWF